MVTSCFYSFWKCFCQWSIGNLGFTLFWVGVLYETKMDGLVTPPTPNRLDPAITHPVLDRQLTTISFSPITPAVLTGDDSGAAYVYRLKNLPSVGLGGSAEEQSSRLQEVIQSKTRMNMNVGELAPAAVV